MDSSLYRISFFGWFLLVSLVLAGCSRPAARYQASIRETFQTPPAQALDKADLPTAERQATAPFSEIRVSDPNEVTVPSSKPGSARTEMASPANVRKKASKRLFRDQTRAAREFLPLNRVSKPAEERPQKGMGLPLGLALVGIASFLLTNIFGGAILLGIGASVAAVVLGIVKLNRTRRGDSGRTLAWIGTILGGAWLLFVLLAFIALIVAFSNGFGG